MARGQTSSKGAKKAREEYLEKEREKKLDENPGYQPLGPKDESKDIKVRRKVGKPPISKAIMTTLASIKGLVDQADELKELYEAKLLECPLVLTDGAAKPEDNKELYTYEEALLKLVMQLDSIFVPVLVERNARKSGIQKVQDLLKVVDEYKKDLKNCLLVRKPKPVPNRNFWISALGLVLGILGYLFYLLSL